MKRWGMTVPFIGVPLHAHADWFRELVDLGYTDVWSAEADGADGFTPLTLAAAWTPELRLGTAIIPAFTRGPACLAQCAASLADAAPGRFVLGVGTSSNVIVERWNGIEFDKPYERTRDTVRFLREAFGGDKIRHDYETFSVQGFKLGQVPAQAPPILVAALRPGMLRLAGREGDGAIINWLAADDVRTVVPHVHDAAVEGAHKEIVARIFVAPIDDPDAVRAFGKFAVAAYLNVPVYAEFHRWLGREDQLATMWEQWAAGDRRAAVESIPDSLVDELIVHGPPAACREHIERYVANGVDTPALAILPFPGVDQQQAVRDLAPR